MVLELEAKTKTFAGIYESQGHYVEALNIYIDLLKKNPLDEDSADNIKRIQFLIKKSGEEKKRAEELQISALDTFLQKTYAYKNTLKGL